MQNITYKYIPTSIMSRGQVYIPAEIRKHLGIGNNGKVAFRITANGDVLLTVPRYQSITDLAGAAGKLPHDQTEQGLKHMDELPEEIPDKNV